jgi:ElaA protein
MMQSDAMKIEVTDDIPTCQALRRVVFIDEQGVSEADEVDGLDGRAIHLLAWDGDCPVGTARLLVKGAVGKIGRVCVLPEVRGSGLGAALIGAALEELGRMPGVAEAYLGAQGHATGFYEKLGFAVEGEEFLDAGIPHRHMRRAL